MTTAPPSLHTRREAALRIQRTISALVANQPFFGITAMHLLPAKPDSSKQSIAADGVTLYYNPQWAIEATSRQLFHAIAHCVTACALKHHTRRGDRNQARWQKASREVTQHILLPHDLADAEHGSGENRSVVQVYNTLPEPPNTPSPSGSQEQPEPTTQEQDPNPAAGPRPSGQPNSPNDPSDRQKDTSPDTGGQNPDSQPQPDNGQSKQDQQQQPDPGSSGTPAPTPPSGDPNTNGKPPPPDQQQDQGQKPPTATADDTSQPDPSADRGEILDHPADPTDPQSPSEELRWDDITHQAMVMSKGQGLSPGNLEQIISRSHAPPIDWRTELREFIEALSPEARSWSRPHRKHIARGLYLAGPAADNIPDICFAVDTSASLDTEALARVWGEIREAADMLEPQTVRVILCDAAIQDDQTHEGHELPEELNAKGRRGTDFRPVFKTLQSEPPPFLIYLTDLDCNRYPDTHPDYPVLWVCTDPDSDRDPPFGERINLPPAELPQH